MDGRKEQQNQLIQTNPGQPMVLLWLAGKRWVSWVTPKNVHQQHPTAAPALRCFDWNSKTDRCYVGCRMFGSSNQYFQWWIGSTLLLGGFNPSEKYQSNSIISPNRDEHNKYLKPPPSSLFHPKYTSRWWFFTLTFETHAKLDPISPEIGVENSKKIFDTKPPSPLIFLVATETANLLNFDPNFAKNWFGTRISLYLEHVFHYGFEHHISLLGKM